MNRLSDEQLQEKAGSASGDWHTLDEIQSMACELLRARKVVQAVGFAIKVHEELRELDTHSPGLSRAQVAFDEAITGVLDAYDAVNHAT